MYSRKRGQITDVENSFGSSQFFKCLVCDNGKSFKNIEKIPKSLRPADLSTRAPLQGTGHGCGVQDLEQGLSHVRAWQLVTAVVVGMAMMGTRRVEKNPPVLTPGTLSHTRTRYV